MMTPMQGVAATPINLHKFEPYTQENSEANADFSFQTLADVTKAILHHAFWLAEQKQNLSLKEYKKLLYNQGWQGEEKKYLKIAATFGKFEPQDFAQVEPRTIYQLAERSKQYQKVIDRLLDLSVINQETVRTLIQKQRTPRAARPKKPSIWRRLKNGGRYCQIPPIHEASEQTGTTLQRMMDEEGLTAQQIVAEAIALRQAYKEGQLTIS
ncbi:hypothetical protein [Nostoc parmelioides]|uniref:Uncharacterized protein n=1 Tax=Nostoc parmelioides FACHB-3921 TaxID=2692909 RepID=A0ABR8BFA1_9NOSO|nr:hypothetical protein [Nostoc parmelioides]MBD2252384.1 hypothetical protein [Nostoc parmelioides FACHB-3921]